MKVYPHLLACPVCGSLARYSPQHTNQTVICQHCRCVVWRSSIIPHWLLLPLTLTALITLLLACFSPVMTIDVYGMRNAVSLWQTVSGLASNSDMPVLALGAACLLFLLPLAQLWLHLLALLLLRIRGDSAELVLTLNLLRWLRPWCMTDVALLGFVVSAIKLSGQFTVAAGPGGWALAVSVIISAILSNQDPRRYWLRVPTHVQGA